MPYPNTVALQVLINGVDRTANVWLQDVPLIVESVLTRQVDSASFTIGNYAGLGFTVKEWDEVVISDGATKLFGGYIQQTDMKLTESGNRVDLDVRCSDYAAAFDHTIIKWQYPSSQTDAFMINDLFTKFLSGFDTTTYVQTLKTYPRIRFNRMTMRQIIDQLAKAAGGDWYVDSDKKLHYFLSESSAAPFDLSESPNLTTTFPFSNMTKNADGTGVINRVEVVGGNYLSGDVTIFLSGTGQDTRIITPFSMSGPSAGGALQVWRNDGTVGSPVWTSMTVKVGYIDTLASATDVLTYFNEKVLEQQSAWPNLPNAVKVFGRYNIPLRTRYSDSVSYAYYGRYFDAVINDPSIVDKTTARQRAQGMMMESSIGSTALGCTIRQPGLRSGQTIKVTNTALGLSAQSFTINRAVLRISIGGFLTINLSLGIYRPELIDIILDLAKTAKTPPEWRDDEVLEEVIQLGESVIGSEAFSMSTKTGPYKWGADANALVWSFGKWG